MELGERGSARWNTLSPSPDVVARRAGREELRSGVRTGVASGVPQARSSAADGVQHCGAGF